MRKYTIKFVINRMFHRLHQAACPFPGKYPLRLLASNGGEVVYHGKFHSAIWRQFQNLPAKRDSLYLIYDKAGSVLWGTNTNSLNVATAPLVYRYFATTWLSGAHLTEVEPTLIGPYWMYLDDSDTRLIDRPLHRPTFVHFVNSNVAHIRTI